MTSDGPASERSHEAVRVSRLLRPRSIAVVGVSPEPGSFAATVLTSLGNFGYQGSIHLVSRGRTEVLGQPCVSSIDDLPMDIDVAVLCTPRAGVIESLAACGRRRMGGAVVFASGFAETGPSGVAEQDELARVSRAAGLAVLGPNCLGLTNYVDGIPLRIGVVHPFRDFDPVVGLVAQSGGIMSAIRDSVRARGISFSYTISTGNEAVIGVEDFVAELIEHEQTRVIALFLEHIRRPQLFLELAARARQRRKPIVMLHSGRTAAAQDAARSHTGAMVGHYATMKALVEHAGVVLVDSFDELIDVTALLGRNPNPPSSGVGIVTNSGAFRGIAFDVCEAAGLPVSKLSAAVLEKLRAMLPSFIAPDNPLDLATQLMREPQLLGSASKTMLEDPQVGSVVLAIVRGTPEQAIEKARAALTVLADTQKPVAFGVIGGEAELPPEFLAEFKTSKVMLFRSPERALRAMARMTAYGRALQRRETRGEVEKISPVPPPGRGVLAEYLGKLYLAAVGMPVPKGALAHTLPQACEIADEIGYPVVLKAQANDLPHKSDVGGVILDLRTATALQDAWSRLHAAVAHARPDLQLDGVLVEEMSPPGIEMVVGARRDPNWGPVVMVGLGGVWVEILEDIRLLPPDATADEIIGELGELRGAKLLRGARGRPPSDMTALAQLVAKVGALMRSTPALVEIDINPLVVYPEGQGVRALDALVVCEE